MEQRDPDLIIDGKLVVSKVINEKGDINGEGTFTITFEDRTTRMITAAKLRRAEEANTDDD